MRNLKISARATDIILVLIIAALCLTSLSQAAESAMDNRRHRAPEPAPRARSDEKEGVFKVSVPRKDLSVIVAGVKMSPPMASRRGPRSSVTAKTIWSWATWC